MKTAKYYQSLKAQVRSEIPNPDEIFKEACAEGDLEQLAIIMSKFAFEDIVASISDAEQVILAISNAKPGILEELLSKSADTDRYKYPWVVKNIASYGNMIFIKSCQSGNIYAIDRLLAKVQDTNNYEFPQVIDQMIDIKKLSFREILMLSIKHSDVKERLTRVLAKSDDGSVPIYEFPVMADAFCFSMKLISLGASTEFICFTYNTLGGNYSIHQPIHYMNRSIFIRKAIELDRLNVLKEAMLIFGMDIDMPIRVFADFPDNSWRKDVDKSSIIPELPQNNELNKCHISNGFYWAHYSRLLSPIAYASYIGNQEAVELLIALGADVNRLYTGNPNAIQLASHYNRDNIVKLLQGAGASIYDANPMGSDLFLEVFHRLYELINKNLIEARKGNKRLLIVLGETHRLLESFVCEYICMVICRDLGIKDMFIEIDYERLESLNEKKWDTHWLTLMESAKNLSMDIIPIDTFESSPYSAPYSTQALNNRDIEMCSHLNSHYTSGVVIVGAAHLKGITAKNRLNFRHYNTLPIFIHSNSNAWNVVEGGDKCNELENAKRQTPGAENVFILGSSFGLTIEDVMSRINQAAAKYRKVRHDYDLSFMMYREYVAKSNSEHNKDHHDLKEKASCKMLS